MAAKVRLPPIKSFRQLINKPAKVTKKTRVWRFSRKVDCAGFTPPSPSQSRMEITKIIAPVPRPNHLNKVPIKALISPCKLILEFAALIAYSFAVFLRR